MPTTSLRKRTNRRTILAISLKIVASSATDSARPGR